MAYTLLRGSFVIRYPDIPLSGPEPDGDTVKFLPDNPAWVQGLPRVSGVPPKINSRGISVRLEAIDALETHYQDKHGKNKHQELQLANAARDELLSQLGFTNVKFLDNSPNKVASANHDSLPGYVLSNGIDANGRLIGFVYAGDDWPGADGSTLTVDEAVVDRSVNAKLLANGLAYPAFYGTLPAALREHLATKSGAARTAQRGLWPRSTADKETAAEEVSPTNLQSFVIWPKLFRRVVEYFADGNDDFDNFNAWLLRDAVNRDDEIFRLDTQESGHLHDVVTAAGNSIQLTIWPEDFVIKPDPAPID
ncbi:hypothetical protein TruAng_012208 [Truncatella angustata]|nr:hypothetical protein TruAng_012208 [Truncatella angustata]